MATPIDPDLIFQSRCPEPEPDLECKVIEQFENTIVQQADGRYTVTWPWVDRKFIEMDNMQEIAEITLASLTISLNCTLEKV